MTLLGAILKKVRSMDSINKKYTSPPPEIDDTLLEKKKFKKKVKKCRRVRYVVDSSSPYFNERQMYRLLPQWKLRVDNIYADNMRILFAITNAYLSGGKVDSHWNVVAPQSEQYYNNRVQNYNKINRENKEIYKLIKKIITLRMKDAAIIGTVVVELFTDVCPATCQLFLELVDGDGLGHGYVGTQLFSSFIPANLLNGWNDFDKAFNVDRKVPNLYWSGGDVIFNNGFGCYAQRGRLRPIAAENYHFSHSMPGLLSMQVSSEGYVCGVFNITFKPLPQFDLKNVVFGRIVRPSSTYEVITKLGSPLNSHPVIEIFATRRKLNNKHIKGLPNTVLKTTFIRKVLC